MKIKYRVILFNDSDNLQLSEIKEDWIFIISINNSPINQTTSLSNLIVRMHIGKNVVLINDNWILSFHILL